MGIKICPFPFSRENFDTPSFVPCCSTWLANSYYQLDQHSMKNELRKSIIDQSYKYCQRDVCNMPLIELDEAQEIDLLETYISKTSAQKIIEEDYTFEYPITSITLDNDNVCNLACPSCRTEKITTQDDKKINLLIIKTIQSAKKLKDVQKIKFAGNSDFFFSKMYQKYLILIEKLKLKQLKEVSILTNGLLVTPQTMNKLGEAAKLITELNVSIDAGDEDTYKLVRGGNWKQLNNNLNYIKNLKQNGQIKRFIISFVVQKNNLESILDFIELGKIYDVDFIKFTDLLDWKNMGIEFKEHAVHLEGHPLHDRYIELKNLAKKTENVHFF